MKFVPTNKKSKKAQRAENSKNRVPMARPTIVMKDKKHPSRAQRKRLNKEDI